MKSLFVAMAVLFSQSAWSAETLLDCSLYSGYPISQVSVVRDDSGLKLIQTVEGKKIVNSINEETLSSGEITLSTGDDDAKAMLSKLEASGNWLYQFSGWGMTISEVETCKESN